MDIQYIRSQQLTETIWSFYFTKPPGLKHEAGDYVELALAYPDNPTGGRRWFTIASAPEESELQFTVKLPPSPSRFKRALHQLQAGQTATISPPIGTFNLPRRPGHSLLWVAGGIGITPYRSMALHLCHRVRQTALPKDIVCLYAARKGEHVFADDIARAAKIHQTHQRPSLPSIARQVPDWQQRIIYLSGPEPLCVKLFEQLKQAGHPPNQLKLDYFPGYWDI